MNRGSVVLPEDEEVRRKRSELEVKQITLADHEVVLATLEAELRVFEVDYFRRVGCYYAELDELLAKMAQQEAELNPTNVRLREVSDEARQRAQASKREVSTDAGAIEPAASFHPTTELRRLFRDVAKALHPDCASDNVQRARRTELMARANSAYRAGDEEALRALLFEWQSDPEAVEPGGVGAELVKLIRMIDRVNRAILDAEARLVALKGSDLALLMQRSQLARQHGRDVLAEIGGDIVQQIQDARSRTHPVQQRNGV